MINWWKKLKYWKKFAIISFFVPFFILFWDGWPSEDIWTALLFPYCFIETGGGHPPACILTGVFTPFIYSIVFGFIGLIWDIKKKKYL